MRRKNVSAATLASLLVVMASGVLLTSCATGGGAGHDLPLPVITLAPASASVPTGGPLQFAVTVVSPTSTTITWSVDNILGGNSTLGTISTTGLYIAPATVPNPSTVTIKATSSAETNPYGSAIVTITPPVVSTVAVAPADSSTLVGTSVQFTATVTGTTNTAVAWYVNGVAGGSSTVGTISSSGLYVAPSSVPSIPTVVVTATSQADNSQSASTTLTLTVSNSAPLFVNFGPNGDTGSPNTTHYNGLFTSVTVCLPATIDCQTIPDVLVDTSSVGLRVLNSALTTVPSTELGTVMDSTGNQVEECVQFADTSYVWGPVLIADVAIAGEKASSIPIQVIGDTTFPVPSNGCLSLGSGPSLDTVEALGANGILGVGSSVQDCGPNCAAGQIFSGYPYYVCPSPSYVCQTAYLPVVRQVSNPIAFFAKDNNGVEISLPTISSAGAPSLPYTNAAGTSLVPAGLLIFGVGTESNNAIPTGTNAPTVYALDENGQFEASYVHDNTTYQWPAFLDSRSTALYVLDPTTLSILTGVSTANCPDNGYYCPNSTLTLSSIGLTGYGNVGSGTITLSIANADTRFANSPGYAAFNDLGGESGNGLATDYFDLGLPFFFGNNVFVGIAGTTVPNKVSAPNGYVAF
jgi:predicted small secreted protein